MALQHTACEFRRVAPGADSCGAQRGHEHERGTACLRACPHLLVYNRTTTTSALTSRTAVWAVRASAAALLPGAPRAVGFAFYPLLHHSYTTHVAALSR